MDRREFLTVAGVAATAALFTGNLSALAGDKPTVCSQSRRGGAAYARVLRPNGRWVAVHRRPTGPALAVVTDYCCQPVA